MIIFHPRDAGYRGIRWERKKANLIHYEGKIYDRLDVEVTCHRKKDWEALKEEFESNNEFSDNPELKEKHFAKNRELKHHYKTSIWFDITACYGREFNFVKDERGSSPAS